MVTDLQMFLHDIAWKGWETWQSTRSRHVAATLMWLQGHVSLGTEDKSKQPDQEQSGKAIYVVEEFLERMAAMEQKGDEFEQKLTKLIGDFNYQYI